MLLSKLFATAALVASAFALPAADALPELEKRNCPRYELGAATAIGSLYLGKGNNKSRQVERLIETAIAFIVEKKCEAEDIYLWCKEDGDHYDKRDYTPSCPVCPTCPTCPVEIPYKNCDLKCKYKDVC
ncbi:MAG: hypothetical protein M1829_000143 [Trizodia sp. TS-e1964]|nr:MAG: hypothetical protein M1829_000143 [Trizodia sp. TS-e1964]